MAQLIRFKFTAEICELFYVESPTFHLKRKVSSEKMAKIVKDYVCDILKRINDDFDTALGARDITDFSIRAETDTGVQFYDVTFALDDVAEIQVEIEGRNNDFGLIY